jgi:hypothetical protein
LPTPFKVALTWLWGLLEPVILLKYLNSTASRTALFTSSRSGSRRSWFHIYQHQTNNSLMKCSFRMVTLQDFSLHHQLLYIAWLPHYFFRPTPTTPFHHQLQQFTLKLNRRPPFTTLNTIDVTTFFNPSVSVDLTLSNLSLKLIVKMEAAEDSNSADAFQAACLLDDPAINIGIEVLLMGTIS